MDLLVQLNNAILALLPPGVKIALDWLPLSGYSMLLSLLLSLLGLVLLVAAIRYDPPRKVPEGVRRRQDKSS